MEKEGLAELVQGVGAGVEELVVDDPGGEVVGPLPLAQGQVQAACKGGGEGRGGAGGDTINTFVVGGTAGSENSHTGHASMYCIPFL